MMYGLIILGVVYWLLTAILGAWVASQKGREPAEGFILALMFSGLGVIVESLLPTNDAELAARRVESE